ncbi:Uncharacterised protein [Parabacteroides distasonis]|uniref:Uncharacterized protein n=1 Tax=Parabacteroides distasonis TaxID=823 RepID=A0A8D9NYK7_PARDI|nr:Uncharacterised protein [Parabacteroides distasonis]
MIYSPSTVASFNTIWNLKLFKPFLAVTSVSLPFTVVDKVSIPTKVAGRKIALIEVRSTNL